MLHFLPGRFGPEFWKLPEARALRKLLEACRSGLRFHGRGADKCAQLLQRLDRRTSSLEGLATFFAVFHRLAAIEQRASLAPRRAVEPGSRRIDPRLQQVLSWTESAPASDVTQRAAARLIRMSPAAFSRFFRNQTGRTFVAHLNEFRIARACVSLAAENWRITEIALEAGFGNLSNFNRRFREIVGMAPRDYRASLPARREAAR